MVHSSTVKMEAIYFSEKLVEFNGLLRLLSKNTELIIPDSFHEYYNNYEVQWLMGEHAVA
jgi:hypothetical protein